MFDGGVNTSCCSSVPTQRHDDHSAATLVEESQLGLLDYGATICISWFSLKWTNIYEVDLHVLIGLKFMKLTCIH